MRICIDLLGVFEERGLSLWPMRDRHQRGRRSVRARVFAEGRRHSGDNARTIVANRRAQRLHSSVYLLTTDSARGVAVVSASSTGASPLGK